MKKIFAVSFLAIMVATSASAVIVSQENIVGTGSVSVNVPTTGTNKGKVVISGPTLSGVATSGSYNDLSDKPTIPTVNNATLTIQKNGTNVATFTANSGTAATANITVPTKTSDLTNDSGFLTSHQNISGKMDKVVADDKNGVVVRKGDGTAMKGTGTDISVSDEGAISVTHATSADTANAVAWGNVSGKPSTFAPAAHNQASNTINAMTGYAKADAAAAIATTDSLNTAIGKLEKALDGKQASGSYVTTSRKVNNKALSSDITLTASDVGAAATSHNHASQDVNAMTGYAKADAAAAIATTDSLNTAIGKLEKALDGKQAALGYTAENVANKETRTTGYDTTSDTKYPTTKVVNQMIIDGKADINGTLTDLGNTKQNKITAGTAGNVVTYSGTQGTFGTPVGFDHAPTANSTNLVKSGAIKTALDAKQDKLTSSNVTTSGTGAVVVGVSASNGAVTVSKGNVQIPSGSETATTYASIWVE